MIESNHVNYPQKPSPNPSPKNIELEIIHPKSHGRYRRKAQPLFNLQSKKLRMEWKKNEAIPMKKYGGQKFISFLHVEPFL